MSPINQGVCSGCRLAAVVQRLGMDELTISEVAFRQA